MNRFSRHTGNVISALALLLVSSYAYAVDCPGGSNFYYSATGSVTPTTTTINVAVASNFKDAAKDLANGYVAGTSYKVNLCQGSSGTISSSINGGNPYNIALFLSADQSFADAVTVALGSSFPYANGVPVFLLSPNAYGSHVAADYFATGQTHGATADGLTSYVILNHASGTPAAGTIAIANHSSAPYGIAASTQILYPMGGGTPPNGSGYSDLSTPATYIYNATTNTASACNGLVSGSQWQCEYNNVDLTLTAIDSNSVTGGFVGWSQVCNSTTYPTNRYVKFPDYVLAQYGVLIDIADSTQETVAANLVSYMDVGSGTWNTFLTNHCYVTF
ncbi:substrate-binding domain-containing protein [Methylobacter sp.]|uniref:substrate-binding domain-containing protein n=1 Tax=Methylobacter sp. TaxID=2051955 RepID=UPI002FDCA797